MWFTKGWGSIAAFGIALSVAACGKGTFFVGDGGVNGDAKASGAVGLAVNTVSLPPTINKLSPPQGSHYVQLNITILNVSVATAIPAHFLLFSLHTDKAIVYVASVTSGVLTPQCSPTTSVAQGGSFTCAVAFEVTDGEVAKTLSYDDHAGHTVSTSVPNTTPPPPCDPPAGPYGVDQGTVVDPAITFQGYKPNATTATTIKVGDFLDCDGRFGINALLLIEGAAWNGYDQVAATQLSGESANLEAEGVRVLYLLIEDGSSAPATAATAQAWRTKYSLTGDPFFVAADPGKFALKSGVANGLPIVMLINPRTLAIQSRVNGWAGASQIADAITLAKTNKQ